MNADLPKDPRVTELEKACFAIYKLDTEPGTDGGVSGKLLGFAKKALTGAATRKKDDAEILDVQFNPSTLEFTVSPGATPEVRDVQAHDKEKEDLRAEKWTGSKQNMTLSMTLVFDSLSGSKTPVDDVVMSFLGTVESPAVSKVAFCWGKLRFEGIMQTVDADYTMFEPDGTPQKANVRITMKVWKTEA